ncbi:hypothetical protein DSECCO2_662750 [anaerobic digester metagenome]
MEPADDVGNPVFVADLARLLDNRADPRVRAAGYDDEPILGPAGERGIVDDGVVPDAVRGVDVAARGRPLELEPPLDLAEEDQVLRQPERGRGEEDFPVPEEFLDREVAPDLPDAVAAPGEERIRVGDERGFDALAALEDGLGMEPDESVESPGVVEVAVGDDDIIDAEEVDPHLPGVLDEDTRVAGIEENPGPAVLDVDREPRFREEVAVGEGGVIHEDGQFHPQRLRQIAAEGVLRDAASAANGSMQVLGMSRLRKYPEGVRSVPPEKRSYSP